MVDLIKNNILNTSTLSPNKTYQTFPAQISQPVETSDEKVGNAKNKNISWVKGTIPAVLLTGGGILLYHGFKTPTKAKLYQRFINNRLFEMEKKMHDYSLYVRRFIDASFDVVSEDIARYNESKYFNFADSVRGIKILNNPYKVLDAQDISFEMLTNLSGTRRGGASEVDTFDGTIKRIKKDVMNELASRQARTNRELEDAVHIPPFSDGTHSDIVEEGENRLLAMKASMGIQLSDLTKTKLAVTLKNQYKKVAEAITSAREFQTQAKENIIHVSFAHIKRLLRLEPDFNPTYFKVPTLENFEKLSPNDLKPHAIPQKLRDTFSDNIFIEAIQNKDFSNLTEQDLSSIFYAMPYDNTLKDLGFLIDRLRLREAIVKSKYPNSKKYDVIIAKLEYLSNKLHEFGKNELLIKASKDFDKMNLEQRKSALYYISTVSRRLGYETIEKMDKDFAMNNSVYAKLNIRNYMKIFKDNPDLYFI